MVLRQENCRRQRERTVARSTDWVCQHQTQTKWAADTGTHTACKQSGNAKPLIKLLEMQAEKKETRILLSYVRVLRASALRHGSEATANSGDRGRANQGQGDQSVAIPLVSRYIRIGNEASQSVIGFVCCLILLFIPSPALPQLYCRLAAGDCLNYAPLRHASVCRHCYTSRPQCFIESGENGHVVIASQRLPLRSSSRNKLRAMHPSCRSLHLTKNL
jgi:hypothetical protein